MMKRVEDKLLENLHGVLGKLGEEIKRTAKLEEEAEAILKNLRKILEGKIKNELEGVKTNAHHTFGTGNLRMKIDISEYYVDVIMYTNDPPDEFGEPLSPHSVKYLYIILSLLKEGKDIIKEAEEKIEEWKERNDEWEKILKALKSALTPFILEDI